MTSAGLFPTEKPYDVVVPYWISDVAGFDVVQETVAVLVPTLLTTTLEITGGVVGGFVGDVVVAV